jgi:hypothetical protein
MADALATWPIIPVFSLRWEASEASEEGIARESLVVLLFASI